MPSLTRSDLVTRIGDLIGDPNNTRWTATKKQQKIQEAQEKFVRDTRCLVDVSQVSIVAGTSEYSLPSDVLDINRLAVNNIELARRSKFEIDIAAGGADWTDDEGTPEIYYVDLDPNNKKVRLYPIPKSGDAGTNNLVYEYVKIPPALSADADVPLDSHTLLVPYHMAIAYWAARELLLVKPTQADLVTAGEYSKEYTKLVDDCISMFRGMSRSRQPRILGGRYYKGL